MSQYCKNGKHERSSRKRNLFPVPDYQHTTIVGRLWRHSSLPDKQTRKEDVVICKDPASDQKIRTIAAVLAKVHGWGKSCVYERMK